MNRKKFFVSAGSGLLGFVLMKTFPFNVFNKSRKKSENPVSVKINPAAVRRDKR